MNLPAVQRRCEIPKRPICPQFGRTDFLSYVSENYSGYRLGAMVLFGFSFFMALLIAGRLLF
jgi:hypothetical protein